MTHLWSKAFSKDTVLIFTIPTGLPVWPNTCHDPLCIDHILPVIRRSNWKVPWVIRGIQPSSAYMKHLGGSDSKRQWEGDHLNPLLWDGNCSKCRKTLLKGGGGVFLRKFFCRQGKFPPFLKYGMRHVISPYFESVPNGGKSSVGRWIGVWWVGERIGKKFIRRKIFRSLNGNTLPVWTVTHKYHRWTVSHSQGWGTDGTHE